MPERKSNPGLEYTNNQNESKHSPTRSDAERFALKQIQENGPLLAREYPEIINDARANMTAADIVKKYEVTKLFGVNDIIAKKIVSRALEELLTPKERETRAHEILSTEGTRKKEEKVGIFSYTAEERRARSALAGAASKGVSGNRYKSGEAARDQKAGVHAFTREQLQEAGKKGYENRDDKWFGGKIINGMDEGSFALSLANNPEYLHKAGKHAGTPDRSKILLDVNKLYGQNRNEDNIRAFFRRNYKK